MYLFTYILEIKNMYKYELDKYMYKICNQMLPNDITKDHVHISKYHNYHTIKTIG